MRIGRLTWMTGIVVCGMVGVAHGEIRTWAVEGMVNNIIDPVGALDFAELGAPVRFEFSFDSETPDLNSTPTLGVYLGISSSLTIGDVEISSDSPTITIQHPSDLFAVGVDISVPGFLGGSGGFRLGDQIASAALTNASLPEAPYPLELFPVKVLGITLLYPDPGSSSPYTLGVLATVGRFYVVPEPTSASLLLFSLLLLTRRHF